MQQKSFFKLILPLLAICILVNIVCLVFANSLNNIKVNHIVLLTGNCLLFLLSVFALFLHYKASKATNTAMLVSGAMAGTFIKLIVVATATLVYIKVAKQNASTYAILASMALYFVYTIFEVKIAVSLNKKVTSK